MLFRCAHSVDNSVDFGALIGSAMLIDESVTMEMCFLFSYSAGHFICITKEDRPIVHQEFAEDHQH